MGDRTIQEKLGQRKQQSLSRSIDPVLREKARKRREPNTRCSGRKWFESNEFEANKECVGKRHQRREAGTSIELLTILLSSPLSISEPIQGKDNNRFVFE